jgi:glycosyltransferase involved in cell wall biosynthesis
MENKNMKIGVVIPTFNRKDLLKRAIESVLSQTYENYIVCVVEDCSPDDTKVMMNEYKENEKIHYIRLDKNSGVNVARNTALDFLLSDDVQCDYITMLDDDDYFTPGTFQKINNVVNELQCEWLLFNKIYEDGRLITQAKEFGVMNYLYDYYTDLKLKGDVAMIFSKKLLLNNRFESKVSAREYLLYLKISNLSDMYMYNFNAVVCNYLNDGLTHKQSKLSKVENSYIRELEVQILKKLNLNFSQLEYLKAKGRFFDSVYYKNYNKSFKYFRHIIKWKLKELFRY